MRTTERGIHTVEDNTFMGISEVELDGIFRLLEHLHPVLPVVATVKRVSGMYEVLEGEVLKPMRATKITTVSLEGEPVSEYTVFWKE